MIPYTARLVIFSVLCSAPLIASAQSFTNLPCYPSTLQPAPAVSVSAESGPPEPIFTSLGSFGLAAGDLYHIAAGRAMLQVGSKPEGIRADLNAIALAYLRSRCMGTQGPKLLDAHLSVLSSAPNFLTEGAVLIGSAPARWTASQSINMVNLDLEASISQRVAADIKSFMGQTGRHPLDQRPLSATEQAQLDAMPSLRSLRSVLGNDQSALDLVDGMAQQLVTGTKTEQLEELISQAGRIDPQTRQPVDLEKHIVDDNTVLSQYISITNLRLSSLETAATGTVNTLTGPSSTAVRNLASETTGNSAQFNAVEAITYSHGSAHDKLNMLKAGYKSDTLSSDDLKQLTDSLEGQARREDLENDAKTMVGVTQDLQKIATGLGLPSAVGEAFQDVSAAGGIFEDVIGGHYLDAVTGLVGLFGHHESEMQALQKHIDKEFEQVNKQLNQLLQGEKALAKGIDDLSSQMNDFALTTESHLNEIDGRLENVQSTLNGVSAAGAVACANIETFVDSRVGYENVPSPFDHRIPDMRDPKNLEEVKAYRFYKSLLRDCGTFLAKFSSVPTTLKQGLGPFAFDPMEYWVFANAGANSTVGVADGDKNAGVKNYKSSAQLYDEDLYHPAVTFYLQAVHSPLKSFGMSGGLTNAQAFQYASIPVPDVPSLRKKLRLLGSGDAACVSDTYLSISMVSMLCEEPMSDLDTVDDQLEQRANEQAERLLQVPIFLDAVPNISHWALVFYPVFDFWSTDKEVILENPSSVLDDANYQPGGDQIVGPALDLDTLGVAQANVLYGDVLAAAVFDGLWDQDKGLPADVPGAPNPPQSLFILSKVPGGNTYLRRNVLMVAMDAAEAHGAGPVDRDLAYDAALDFFQRSDNHQDFLLRGLFQDKITFSARWAPKDSKVAADYCERDADPADRKAKCLKIPVARILGQVVDLPSVEAFSGRIFVYPQSLLGLITLRDRLAEAAATYSAFDVAVQGAQDDEQRVRLKSQLAKSLVEAIQ